MTSAGRAREREREWTDSLLKFHSRICVCLSLKYWMKITLLHTHWCGGGKSANTYRDVRVVSLTLTEVCILLASQCCLEGVRSDCNHVWMFLACFLHISVLWHYVNVTRHLHSHTRPCCTPPCRHWSSLVCAVLCVSLTAAFFRRLTLWIIYGTNEFAQGCRCSSESVQGCSSASGFTATNKTLKLTF